MNNLKLPIQLDVYSNKKITNVLPDDIKPEDLSLISRNMDNYYLQFNFGVGNNLPHQGFKIHISSSWSSHIKILNTIFLFCKKEKVTFKYISNHQEIRKNLSGNAPLWSTGKFITIYPSGFNEFKYLIRKLYSLPELASESGIYILTDRRYKDSNNIFYRYGIITKSDNYIYDLNGKKLYKDYEELKYKLPSFVMEPFPKNSDTYKEAKYIYKDYIPKKSLNSKASGSVFEAMANKKNVVLKNAKYGYEDEVYTEIQKLKNEEKFLKILKYDSFIPNYINSFYEDKDYFLVEEFIEGINVESFRALPRHSFINDNVNKEKLYETYSYVITDIINNLSVLHDKGIFLGDISANNILINVSTNKTYFIDLGQSALIRKKTKNPIFYRTPGFYDESISSLTLKEQDKRQLGYLIMSLFCRANMFLKIDFTGNMSINFFEKFAKIENVPSIFVYITEKLLKDPKANLHDIINLIKNTPYKERKNDTKVAFPHTLLQSLTKTCLVSKIDNIKFNHSRITDQNGKTFLNSQKYMLLEMDILEKGYCDKQLFTNEFDKQLFIDFHKLLTIIKRKKSNIHSLSLGTILSLLFCMVTVISRSNKGKEYIIQIEEVLNFINQNYQVKQKEGINYRMKYSSNYMSPYLYDGTAGVLNLCLMLKEKFRETKYDKLAFALAHELTNEKMPKNASFNHGLAGIVYVLVKYRQLYHDISVDKHIKVMISCFDTYTYNWNGNKYIVDTTFSKATTNFEDGNKGVIKALISAVKLFDIK